MIGLGRLTDGHTESGERLLRMHAQEVVELILKKAGEDVLK